MGQYTIHDTRYKIHQKMQFLGGVLMLMKTHQDEPQCVVRPPLRDTGPPVQCIWFDNDQRTWYNQLDILGGLINNKE